MISLVGIDYRTAPLDVREEAMARLRDLPRPLAPRLAAEEAAVLATCNRVEVYLRDGNEDAARNLLGTAAANLAYLRRGTEAVRHLCRVAASLEAMVLGEPQIQGQLREARKAASEAGDLSGLLGTAFETALRAGRRVRAETALGTLSVSVPSVAVRLARKIFGDLTGRAVLLLGTGEMAQAVAHYLAEEGARLVIASFRRPERAQALATEVGAEVVPFEAVDSRLARADLVVASTAAPHPILSRERLAAARKARGGRPLFLIDIAVPRDVDPAVAGMEDVFLYSIDDLEEIAAAHRAERSGEIERAEAIVEEEVENFCRKEAAIEAAPTIAALEARAEAIRTAELAAARARLGEAATPEVEEVLERLSHNIIQKLLHGPRVETKRLEDETPVREKARILRKLFRLVE